MVTKTQQNTTSNLMQQ